MKFTDLAKGTYAKISGFDEKNNQHITRYLSLGLIPGTTVKIIRMAPLGCPIQVQAGSTLFSIRKAEAQYINVEAI